MVLEAIWWLTGDSDSDKVKLINVLLADILPAFINALFSLESSKT
jgi:hypothetical protein